MNFLSRDYIPVSNDVITSIYQQIEDYLFNYYTKTLHLSDIKQINHLFTVKHNEIMRVIIDIVSEYTLNQLLSQKYEVIQYVDTNVFV